MLLADHGADVILVERVEPTGPATEISNVPIINRGKRSIAIDLTSAKGAETVLRLVETADGLIEGMRPGVMERLGLGPDVCMERNEKLVYGRMTGWGQTGPLSQVAGHDLNYIALSGALWYSGEPGQPPLAPPTLVGDLGGGALYLTVGMLAGIIAARQSGKGCVVDAAIVDGSANLLNLLLCLNASSRRAFERGSNILDGSHWYRTYRCADGKYVAIGPVEPKFHLLLLEKLQLVGDPHFRKQYDPALWPELTERLKAIFAQKSRAEWTEILEGSDVCFAPVLDPSEAANHPHNVARDVFCVSEGVLQARPAPRFSTAGNASPGKIPGRGEHATEILAELAAYQRDDKGRVRL
jgi:acetyl-CoA hydrolase